MQNRKTSDERASIWSLLSGWWLWTYQTVFSVQMAVIAIRFIWIEVTHNTDDSILETYLRINQGVSPYIIPAAGLTFAGILIGEICFMLIEPFMKWRRKVYRREGVALVLDNPDIKAYLEQRPELRDQVTRDVEEALKDGELRRD